MFPPLKLSSQNRLNHFKCSQTTRNAIVQLQDSKIWTTSQVKCCICRGSTEFLKYLYAKFQDQIEQECIYHKTEQAFIIKDKLTHQQIYFYHGRYFYNFQLILEAKKLVITLEAHTAMK
jgi:hypothetical protein